MCRYCRLTVTVPSHIFDLQELRYNKTRPRKTKSLTGKASSIGTLWLDHPDSARLRLATQKFRHLLASLYLSKKPASFFSLIALVVPENFDYGAIYPFERGCSDSRAPPLG